MPPIYDAIREAIEASDMTRYRIAKVTGIGESQLCLFMRGRRACRSRRWKLADCLGLEITTRRKRKKVN